MRASKAREGEIAVTADTAGETGPGRTIDARKRRIQQAVWRRWAAGRPAAFRYVGSAAGRELASDSVTG